jgi:hypothetical protein
MRHRLHKLLLILVTLSVAFAPLRGAWALPDAGTAGTESHCAGMQHDMQQMDHDTGHNGKADNNSHKCKSGCNGSCCDKSCSACLHAAAAVTVSLSVLPDTPVHEHSLFVTDTFPERHLKPPLRPPLALL